MLQPIYSECQSTVGDSLTVCPPRRC